MPYSFNPHRHVKIWLSKDKEIFLNLENQLRLVKMREMNPDDEITLIYDSKLLSENAIDNLNQFCKKYNIIPKDVRTLLTRCTIQEDVNLVEIYEDEINNLMRGGNLGVASDILRWLKPVYQLGTYSDFDVTINTRKLPKTIPVDRPLLLSLGSIAFLSGKEGLGLNNDIIAVVDEENASDAIKKIQQTLYNYCRINNNSHFRFMRNLYREALISTFGLLIGTILLGNDPEFQLLKVLEQTELEQSTRSVRKLRETIIKLTDTVENFVASTYSVNTPLSNETLKTIADNERNDLKKNLGFWGWLRLPSQKYQEIKEIIDIKDDRDFLDILRKESRSSLLKKAVVYSSGPFAVMTALFPKLFYTGEAIDNEIRSFAFSHYNLDKAFSSNNSCRFHTTRNEFVKSMANGERQICDLSWLEVGVEAQGKREEKIIEATKTIQQFFRNTRKEYHLKCTQAAVNLPKKFNKLHQEISSHIKQIESDLSGCFGFYRRAQRHEKIQALKGILAYFDVHGNFDYKKFQNERHQYQSDDIFASLGKSKTKELIERVISLSREARFYKLGNQEENSKAETGFVL